MDRTMLSPRYDLRTCSVTAWPFGLLKKIDPQNSTKGAHANVIVALRKCNAGCGSELKLVEREVFQHMRTIARMHRPAPAGAGRSQRRRSPWHLSG